MIKWIAISVAIIAVSTGATQAFKVHSANQVSIAKLKYADVQCAIQKLDEWPLPPIIKRKF